MERAQVCRSSGFSRAAPPSLTTNFMVTPEVQRFTRGREGRKQSVIGGLRFVPAGHEVHVLDGLRGGAFEQVVEAGDDDEALAVGRELEAEVAEDGADDVLDLREIGRAADADHGAVGVEVVEAVLDVDQRCHFVKTHVDGGEDAARDGEQVRRELDLVVGEVELLEELAGVAMAEDGVGGEVVGRVHEVGVGGGRFARAGDAGLGVGDDAAGRDRRGWRGAAARARG